MKYLMMSIFLITGLINFYPLVGVLSPERLHALYGLRITDPNLLILMRHRAVLFGLLGGFMIAAAFLPHWRDAALGAGFISMIAFIVLALITGEYNGFIRKVVFADVFALIPLAIAGLMRLTGKG